ncbi:MAG: carboxypeptidase-like regulatory domain-containing protein [Bacteroidales bacterium]|nr:carboxypeptidase-like regulatory domain-containing protein [Bacteroidales bacterium]
MKKIFFAFLLILLASNVLYAQTKSINGYVYDTKTNESIIGALVFSANNKTTTYTNNYGYFSLNINTDDTLKIRHIGYTKLDITGFYSDTTIILYLLTNNEELNEVTVFSKYKKRELIGEAYLSSKEIAKVPAILGEKDVLKSFQTLPGIQGTNEGTTGIAVRGGSPDQNLILLDGIPVYNANHLFGVFSVFNDDAINAASLNKAYLSPEYGGRLSSVLNITTKEGNNDKLKGKASIGLISSKLMIDGPLVKNKSSFLLSVRRTYIDLLARPFIKKIADGAIVAYHFYDINAKFNQKLTNKSRIYISYYGGNDKYRSIYNETDEYNGLKYSLQSNDRLSWGNKTGIIRWNWIPTQKAFSNFVLSTSWYKIENSSSYKLKFNEDNDEPAEENSTNNTSELFEISAKSNLQILISSKFSLKSGINYSHYRFLPNGNASILSGLSNFSTENFSIITDPINSNELSIFFDASLLPIDIMTANIGIRSTIFETLGTIYPLFEPRLNLVLDLNHYDQIKLSYSRTSQALQLLTNSSLGLPTDLWVPSMPDLRPSTANQISLTWFHSFFGKLNISLSAYLKNMQNLVEFKDGALYLYEGKNWTEKIEQGNGTAYGLEMMVKKNIGKLNGWFSYTYSKSLRQFPTINRGRQFHYKYDRPHYLNIIVFYKKNENIDYGLNWVLSSGSRTSLINENYQLAVSNYDYFVGRSHSGSGNFYNQRNGVKLPFYHRLDLSVNFHKMKTNYKRTWSIGLYNAYWQKNPWYIIGTSDGYMGVSLLPLVPNVSYRIEF